MVEYRGSTEYCPQGRCSRAEVNSTRDEIVLVVATHEQRLVVGQVEIEAGNVSVQCRWRPRVEAKATRVQAIADSRIVSRISLCGGSEDGECCRVDPRTGITVEVLVCGLDLSGRKAVDAGWSSGWTAGVALTAFGAETNDALAQCR